MKRRHVFILFLAFLAVLTLGGYTTALAQMSYRIQINSTHTVENPADFILNTYFTVYDKISNSPISDASIRSAEFVLEGGEEKITAAVLQPEVPIYITFLLDTSGSMASADEAVQQAAVAALNSAPPSARISVMLFNEQAEVVQDFSDLQNRAAIERAIKTAVSVENSGTCLYDAAYAAVVNLGQTPIGRRALILFTDGRDERMDGTLCSTHVLNDVLIYATRPNQAVPISTIGLSGNEHNLNAQELRQTADSTGGFYANGNKEDLDHMFLQVMESLNSQYLAQSPIFVTQGDHKGQLLVTFEDGTILTQDFTFPASQDYLAPPAPVQVNMRVESLEYMQTKNQYRLQLSIDDPTSVSSVRVATWDQRAGVVVAEQTFTNISVFMACELPAEPLAASGEYEFRVSAFDSQGQLLQDATGAPFTASQGFRYELARQLSIASVKIDDEDLAFEVSADNPQYITGYRAWLNDEADNQLVEGTLVAVEAASPSVSIHIPLENVPEGDYMAVVEGLDQAGNIVGTSSYQTISYEPPAPVRRSEPAAAGVEEDSFLENSIWFLLAGFCVVTPLVLLIVYLLLKRGKVTSPVMAAPAARPAPRLAPNAVLTVTQSADAGAVGNSSPLPEESFTIGRSRCNMVINDPSISQMHAIIQYDKAQGVFTICDQSRNGTMLAGIRIPKGQPVGLRPGVEIGLGSRTKVVFNIGS